MLTPNEYKDFDTAELDYILGGITFKTQPMRHQRVALVWAIDSTSKRLTWWFDVGTGKSLTSLYTHQLWGFNRLLIVCPNSVVESWEDQIKEHTDFSYCLLRGARDERRKKLSKSKANIFVVNYEGLQVLFGERVKQGKGTKWVLDKNLVKDANIDAITFDECQRLQSSKSHVFKISKCLSQYTKQIINMTATPYSTGLDDLHSQYMVLDQGKTLGTSLTRFHREYFKQDFWGHWNIRPGETERIIDRVAPVTLHYDQQECFDLPAKRYQTRFVDMTTEQHSLIDSLVNGMSIEHEGEELEFVEPMVVGNKLAQVAGGLLKFRDHTMRLEKQPKLDELDSILKEIPGKAIVFHGYVEEGRMIEERLEKANIGYVSMRSEVKDKAGWKRFKSEDDIRVLVAHPASGGVGLNLQEANTVVFYSNSCAGATVRTQAEGRIWRLGQKNKCLFIDIVLRGSIDEKRLQNVQERADIVQGIKDYISSWK